MSGQKIKFLKPYFSFGFCPTILIALVYIKTGGKVLCFKIFSLVLTTISYSKFVSEYVNLR